MAQDRRKAAEDNYRQKFKDFGLDERFEFIRREWSKERDKRFWCKCKTCGKEFLAWPEVFRGRQGHLLCPNCGAASDGNDVWERSPLCDQAMEYYCQGHSVKETAERYGVTTAKINGSVKKRRLTNGRDWREAGKTARIASQKEKAIQRIKERLEVLGYEYLGGYESENKRIRIRCKKCESEFERSIETVRDGIIVCKACDHRLAMYRQAERKKLKQIRNELKRAEKEAERIKNNPLGLSFYQLEREKKLDEVFVCKECGKEYTPRQYMQSVGVTYFSNAGYCSKECKRKMENRLSKASKRAKGTIENHRHRARKYGCAYDSSVTLPKLIKFKGLRCGICGRMCDPNDHSWSKYFGPMYPTIDHIIPMSKGGGHTWDNVQVAHAICNSYKCDRMEEVIA